MWYNTENGHFYDCDFKIELKMELPVCHISVNKIYSSHSGSIP